MEEVRSPLVANKMRSTVFYVSLLVFLSGCTSEEVETEYGKISTSSSAESVNGATVFSRMFEHYGARVTSARRLNPALERADCIVWIPDDFEVPDVEVVDWFEEWLENEPGRTLIYVGRDFDAAVQYWEQVLNDYDTRETRTEASNRLAASRIAHDLRRRWELDTLDSDWYSIARGDVYEPRELSGKAGWVENLDVDRTALRLGNSPVFDDDFEPLLETEKGPFVARSPRYGGASQLVVVANGSFLLNYPLANHEHRKLAARLIETAGPGERVVFVESGPFGLSIADEDHPSRSHWDIVTRFPFNWMLAQFTAMGIVFCFCRWPIFGRPRKVRGESLTDFGRHITALGALLRDKGDATFPKEQLRKYHEEAGRPRTR